ncbi:hypothetical protein [Thomasclavelia cocleata]|uniref:hypothetical protein n=1 Tax=Thomasclavelia cocleata TaxID=69824 RepID=UPI002493D512|nr:hypothetical protein [Thomasclavelia cocleata]
MVIALIGLFTAGAVNTHGLLMLVASLDFFVWTLRESFNTAVLILYCDHMYIVHLQRAFVNI